MQGSESIRFKKITCLLIEESQSASLNYWVLSLSGEMSLWRKAKSKVLSMVFMVVALYNYQESYRLKALKRGAPPWYHVVSLYGLVTRDGESLMFKNR